MTSAADAHAGDAHTHPPAADQPVWELVQEDIVSMTSEARMLRFEVAKQKRRTWIAVALCVALIIPTLLSWLSYARLGDTLEQVRQNTTINLTNGRLLVECTTPGPNQPTAANQFTTGHDCYDQGQARTGVAVKQVVCAIRPELLGCEASQ